MNELLISCIVFLFGVMLITSWRNQYQEGGKTKQDDNICATPDSCDMGKAKPVETSCATHSYLKHDDDCPGNDMMTRNQFGNLVPIEYNKNSPGVTCCNLLSKCEELCNKHPNCVGFSYNGDRCPLKTSRCDTEVKNGYQFYKKPGSPDSMPNIIPPASRPRINYQQYSGDCPGNDIRFFDNVDLEQCKKQCSEDPRCKGLSYHPPSRKCYTKHNTCPYPGMNFYGFNFHKKY